MNYKINPRNGDKLSVLGYGCMRFGGDSLSSSFSGAFDPKKAEQLIKSAVENGINYFDTAYVYAGSEEVLGKTLQKYGFRDKVYIATKMPLILCRNKSDLDKYFAKHLERLQTDYIDYYLLHMLTDIKPGTPSVIGESKNGLQKRRRPGRSGSSVFLFMGRRTNFWRYLMPTTGISAKSSITIPMKTIRPE